MKRELIRNCGCMRQMVAFWIASKQKGLLRRGCQGAQQGIASPFIHSTLIHFLALLNEEKQEKFSEFARNLSLRYSPITGMRTDSHPRAAPDVFSRRIYVNAGGISLVGSACASIAVCCAAARSHPRIKYAFPSQPV
jgi:hypothetical protein